GLCTPPLAAPPWLPPPAPPDCAAWPAAPLAAPLPAPAGDTCSGADPLRLFIEPPPALAAVLLAWAAFADPPLATIFAPVATVIAPPATMAPAIPPPAAPIMAEVAGTNRRINAGNASNASTNSTMPLIAPQNWSIISSAVSAPEPKSVMG